MSSPYRLPDLLLIFVRPGLGKSHETFYLFSITNPDVFKKRVKALVDQNKITSAEEALKKRAQNRDPHSAGPEAGINVGFSPQGMQKVRTTPIFYLDPFGNT